MSGPASRIDFSQIADAKIRSGMQQLYDYIDAVRQAFNALLGSISAPTWIAVDGGVGFQNAWVNFGAPHLDAAYALITPGLVGLRGEIKNGAGVIFTLPAGFRPPGRARFAIASNTAYGEIVVNANGDVQFVAGSNLAVSLDGIIFSIT